MKTVAVQKNPSQVESLSDSEQTIKEIRQLRWKLSQEYRTWEDIQRLEKEVDEEMKALRIQFKKSN